MAAGDATAADVPGKYDVVLAGKGYIVWNALDPNMPFRWQKAQVSYSPTFVERMNVSGAYGDESQAFFLAASQNDWSLGAGQFFFRGADPDKTRKYYSGVGIDTLSQPGRISVRPNTVTITPPLQNVYAMCPAGRTIGTNSHCYATRSGGLPALQTIDSTGTDTGNGDHGAGVVNQWGMCNDGVNVYIAGATRITKWTGAAFSAFSTATNAGALAFLNNTLFSCDGSTLKSYDGAGTAATLFTWKDATNTALTPLAVHPKLVPFGGKLLIFFPSLLEGAELWIYDGTGTSRVAVLPASVVGYDITVLSGVVYLSGMIYSSTNGTTLGSLPVVYAWANGTIFEVWRGQTVLVATPSLNSIYMPALGVFSGKLVVANLVDTALMEIDQTSGAITTLKRWTFSGTASNILPAISSTPSSFLAVTDQGNTGGQVKLAFYPGSTWQSGTITSSLFDFDNSLTKMFRGIKVDWEQAGTVDIYYGIDTPTALTLLQAAAVSGTEYLFPSPTTGHTLCYRLDLNNSGGVPIVKRVYLRAAPVLQAFRQGDYIIDCTGYQGHNPVRLRDGSESALSGLQLAQNLAAAATATAPFSITDEFGTFTGIIEPDKFELDKIRPGEYIARVSVRQI